MRIRLSKWTTCSHQVPRLCAFHSRVLAQVSGRVWAWDRRHTTRGHFSRILRFFYFQIVLLCDRRKLKPQKSISELGLKHTAYVQIFGVKDIAVIIKPFDKKIRQNNILDDETIGGVKEIIMHNHNLDMFGENFNEKFMNLDFYIGDEIVNNSGNILKRYQYI